MAILKAVVLKHHQRKDKTYPVKIRLSHNDKVAYIQTAHCVTEKMMSKDFTKIKDQYIVARLDEEIVRMRQKISSMGSLIFHLSARELADRLSPKNTKNDNHIEFFVFAEEYIEMLKTKNSASYPNYRTYVNVLRGFVGEGRALFFYEITTKYLYAYEAYLIGKYGEGARAVQHAMSHVKALFNAARLKHNDEDKGDIKIPHYPFARYKIPSSKEPTKRALEIADIRKIRDYQPILQRDELARDLYMLSFYLCGMNSVDFYNLDKIEGERIEYSRSKTKTKRSDSAFISIKIEEEAKQIIDKYKSTKRAFDFSERYSTRTNLNKALNTGLKIIGQAVGIDNLTFYSARHSWATIARNDCDVSKDDVAMALNHSDSKTITDVYIKKDWQRIDRANRLVLDLLRGVTETTSES